MSINIIEKIFHLVFQKKYINIYYTKNNYLIWTKKQFLLVLEVKSKIFFSKSLFVFLIIRNFSTILKKQNYEITKRYSYYFVRTYANWQF